MKVIVSTKETQGQRKSDFSWVAEGKMVAIPNFTTEHFVEHKVKETADGECGCQRCFIGVLGYKGTTTAKVVEMDISEEKMQRTWWRVMHYAGWYKMIGKDPYRPDHELYRYLDIANRYAVGTILEKRGNQIRPRKIGGKA